MNEYEFTVNRSLLTVTDLTFSYGKGKPNVLKNISFTIQDIQRPHKEGPEGELVVILGESGSGKSTLLGLMSGILEPQSGSIQVIEALESTKMTTVKPGMVGVVDQSSTLL